jgi:peptidoglycan/LPS O-acetylase OafA/YrhL
VRQSACASDRAIPHFIRARIMIRRTSLAAAVLLTFALFVVGGRPAAGQIFSGTAHYAAHIAAYAAIAFAYVRGCPQWPLVRVAVLVAIIGGIHETYEISAHDHPFEYVDAAVNALGALAGATLERTWRRFRSQHV